MSNEIVTINRADYDKLVANTAKLDKLRNEHFELKDLIIKEGYSITSNCKGTKLILLKNNNTPLTKDDLFEKDCFKDAIDGANKLLAVIVEVKKSVELICSKPRQ